MFKLLFAFIFVSSVAIAQGLKIGMAAPPIQLKTDSGASFDLESRKGKWTVVYFFLKQILLVVQNKLVPTAIASISLKRLMLKCTELALTT